MSNEKNREIMPYKTEGREIVKRIEHPTPEPIEEKEEVSFNSYQEQYTDTTYENTEYFETEPEPKKKIFPIILGLTTVGLIGYFGLNYLQQGDSNKSVNKAVAGVSSINNNVTSPVAKGTKEELINYYVNESLDVKKSSNDKVETVEEKTVPKTIPKVEKEEEKIIEMVKEEAESVNRELAIIEEKVVKQLPIEKIEQEKVAIEKVETKIVEPEKIVAIEKPIIKEEHVIAPVQTKKVKTKKIYYEKIKPRIITVRDGDSLVSIAERFYGDGMDFKRIIRANSRIRSSKTPLLLGQKIIIPRKDGKKRRRYVIVERGDTLASISKAIYGNHERISTIVRANYRIKSKRSILRLGQKVYVPRLEFFK